MSGRGSGARLVKLTHYPGASRQALDLTHRPSRASISTRPFSLGRIPLAKLAQAGPDRAGDPLTEAAAALKRLPSLRLRLVLGGAAFLGGFNERAPVRYTLIVPGQAPIQRGLAQVYDLIRAAPSRFFGATPRNGVPMSGASRLPFDAAFWPGRAGDLRDPGHWLRAALAGADISEVLAFARRLDSDRVTARAGYFAEAFGRPDIAAALADLRPKAAVRLGDPTEPLHARDTRFGVRDHLGVAGA